jgi:hypothetical protein
MTFFMSLTFPVNRCIPVSCINGNVENIVLFAEEAGRARPRRAVNPLHIWYPLLANRDSNSLPTAFTDIFLMVGEADKNLAVTAVWLNFGFTLLCEVVDRY